jgi:surfeit locus 1 family protein
MKQKLPLWATFFTLIGLIILCSLGAWQIKRLHWKETLLANIEAAYQTDPEKNPQTNATLRNAALKNTPIIHGKISGHFTKSAPLRSGPRPMDEKAGYHLYAPFRMFGGGYLLVNRGWIPADQDPAAPPQGAVTLYGLFREAPRANFFTPPNDAAKNYWYRFDADSIQSHYGIKSLAPYILYEEKQNPELSSQGVKPIPVAQKLEINNNHRGYAFFWFAMAGALLIIYVLRFIVTARR